MLTEYREHATQIANLPQIRGTKGARGKNFPDRLSVFCPAGERSVPVRSDPPTGGTGGEDGLDDSMFRIASLIGVGSGLASRIARAKRSPWIVYWSQVSSSTRSTGPELRWTRRAQGVVRGVEGDFGEFDPPLGPDDLDDLERRRRPSSK